MSHASDLDFILSSMGDSADEVAATLKAAGIQGVRNTVRFLNPVVRYCQLHLRLDNYTLDLMKPNTMRMTVPKKRERDFPMPAPVKEFLVGFNRGAYPDLELPPTDES